MSYTAITRTVNDILTHVKRQFGDEAAVQVTNEDIIRWINAGQLEIFRRSEPVKSSANSSTVAGVNDYAFPPDVLRVQSIYVAGKPLKKLSTQEYDEWIQQYDPLETARGAPVVWTSWGETFSVFPTPETSGNLDIQLRYIKQPTKIDATNDPLSIPDAYYNRLVEYVLGQAYELDENFQAAQMKGDQFSINLDATTVRETASHDTYPSITVLEEDL